MKFYNKQSQQKTFIHLLHKTKSKQVKYIRRSTLQHLLIPSKNKIEHIEENKIAKIEQHLKDVEEANKLAHVLYRRRLLLEQIEQIDQDKKKQ